MKGENFMGELDLSTVLAVSKIPGSDTMGSSMIGQQFGNYRVLSLLGEGGMGAVYLAEHPGIGRRVAVKVLHKQFSGDEQLLGRLMNEARAANAIRHPNIIEILDSGMRPDGIPYLVMELLEGESLGGRIRRVGAMPLRAVIEFTYQTASALGAAHKKGIVHRDLKPDNLFIVPLEGEDPGPVENERIKVLDFGIAKLQMPQPGDSVKTRTGTLMGTPVYMSPEQCRGTKTVDHRSDVYSLGVILFEMLVGQPPFVSDGFGELVNMHLNVPPPSARSARPEVSEVLDGIVLKMLAKNPDDRYPDMTALMGALKLAGGASFAVRGSSPDILNAPTRPAPVVSEPVNRTLKRDTTFSTGVGERMDDLVPAGGNSKGKLVAALVAVVVLGVGVWGFTSRGKSTGTPSAEPQAAAVVAPPPAVAKPPAESVAPAVKRVTLRITSDPAGAAAFDAQGQPLGTTPLALKRPPGGAMTVRLEKDGYTSTTRQVPLDVALERKPASKPRAPRKSQPREAEPAKL
jgi:serine/threonine protein kinase